MPIFLVGRRVRRSDRRFPHNSSPLIEPWLNLPPSPVLDHHRLRSYTRHVGGTDSAGLGLVLLLADDGGDVLGGDAVRQQLKRPSVTVHALQAEGHGCQTRRGDHAGTHATSARPLSCKSAATGRGGGNLIRKSES